MPQEPNKILTITDWLKRVEELETTFQPPELWPQLPSRCDNCDYVYDCWVDPKLCWRKET